jgi:HSP20 family protein
MRAEVNRLQDEMNRLFDRWGVSGGRMFSRAVAFPALNIWEDDDNLFVEAELPGLELSDLEIYVSGENQLSLKGERKLPALEKGTWHRQERGYGAFSRLVELPYAVKAERVTAQFRNGVLTITLPKREEVKPRKIEVKSS